MSVLLDRQSLEGLRAAMASEKVITGSTHNFYLYPARFPPAIARTIIERFSDPNDVILDPFMGGGTAVVEGLALGRSVVGVDLNALAHFVACVKTTPLSPLDEDAIRTWVRNVARAANVTGPAQPVVRNLPPRVSAFMSSALRATARLRFPRQRAFARGVLLRLGQWAVDCRDHDAAPITFILDRLTTLTEEMLTGLRAFVECCRSGGISKNQISSRRLLLCRSSAGLHQDARLRGLRERPRLVFTSPPYPRVHVLYHRWQVRGRRETAAPYWIAQLRDGKPGSHYTGGSRTPTGERAYFAMIVDAFSSVRQLVAPDATVVQLVGFGHTGEQLPRYLEAMDAAGFEEVQIRGSAQPRLVRRVPNRRWYANLQGAVDASSEVLLIHRPRHPRVYRLVPEPMPSRAAAPDTVCGSRG